MATPRVLSRPPIAEALVDIRAAISQPREVFEDFAKEFKVEFPKLQVRRAIRAELKIQGGKLIPPTAEVLGFEGIRLANQDGTIIIQFRPDGFTFNNLKSYIGGDRIIVEALDFWARFAARTKPSAVTRVAFRYINQLDLPFRADEEFTKYLTAPPDLPGDALQRVSEFLSRVVAHPSDDTLVIVTQRLTHGSGDPRILIDVDVSRQGEFSVNPGQLREILDSLRLLRNQTFFALLTEETVSLYV